MAARLTANAIARVNGGNLDLKPVVQMLDLKRVPGAQERYRAVVSDGSAVQQALLAAQLNEVAKSGEVGNGSVVQLLEYVCSTVKNRRIIIILNMKILIRDSETIGNPRLPPEIVSDNPDMSISSSTGHSRDESLNHTSSSVQTTKLVSNSVLKAGNKAQSFSITTQSFYQPPPNYKSHGAIMKNEAPARIIPIAALNPYQGRWTIKARVTAKGDIRRYNNARGDGKVFSFDLLDSDGGEIRATCFNAVVDRFYEAVEVGKVYLLSKGNLKPAQKNFNHLNHQWEIFLEAATSLELCPDEDSSIPTQQFNFKKITEIENAENNSVVDIIGIVTSIHPSVTILRKNGMETQRRILNLKDVSCLTVELTLWGDFCNREGRQLQEKLDAGLFPVLAVKAGKVSDFSGKSVGTISSTQLFIDPCLPETCILREWFDGGGKNAASHSISRDMMPGHPLNECRKTVLQIKDEGLGRGNKPDWVTVKASISYIKTDNFCYTACPLQIGDRQCNKKVTKLANGNWCCDRCAKEFEECDYRYLLQLQIQDHTGGTWVTAFQESGEEIVGFSAKELYQIKYLDHNDSRFGDVVRQCLFEQYLFRLKIKEEHYGEEQQVKITVVKADKVNPSRESKYLLDLIQKLSS
ncbi:replication protein A 70 kDa DNA-binding subunit A-like isoform X1 [Canna indica]|uniref:Replication protein A subunit n=1 Tax=Canna indica TaxID=4628 RepID=A0AAQ3JN52_9LILI|nr:replication protein A 70 kDa DNA-binding subunit A-like isoform X1 [Canna indica]